MRKVIRNPLLVGFRSLDGDSRYGIGDWFEGDPTSRERGAPTSLAAEYQHAIRALPENVGPLLSYGAWLPYLEFPTLNEGGTPVVDVPDLAKMLGLRKLIVKRESANPTGSHKDRMTPLALARAIEVGAEGVVCASSGNAAISLAAYAALAKMPCRILVTAAIADGYRRLLERMGAELVVCKDSHDRWTAMAELARRDWFPITNYAIPAVGSNPYGVQGYKTVAYELFQQVGRVDALVVPCARGDLIWGINEGYKDLKAIGLIERVPALYAAEPYPRVSKVLTGHALSTDFFPGKTTQFSIAGDTATDQAVRAVTESKGGAVAVDDATALSAQKLCARHGLDLEISSASAIGAISILKKRGLMSETDIVVAIGTANSAREPALALEPLRFA